MDFCEYCQRVRLLACPRVLTVVGWYPSTQLALAYLDFLDERDVSASARDDAAARNADLMPRLFPLLCTAY